MRKAVRAIVIKDDQLLVMHRNKFGSIYENLPGGSIEPGETNEHALVRELQEETSIEIRNPRLLYIQHSDQMYGDQLIYLCEYVSGEPALSSESEEFKITSMGKNLFEPGWMSFDDVAKANFIFKDLHQRLLHAIKHGWPNEAEEFTSTKSL